jgi:glycosyltransferase involved in cell wall biosynthesis
MRVLVSAFTCHPDLASGLGSGEDLLGWNLVKQIARHHEVWALTYAMNRPGIEQATQLDPVPNAHFHYVDMPRWLRPLLKYQGTHQVYAYLWQINAYFAARRLHGQHRFDIFHHITYANDWMASYIGALLPVPYVRGPGGGAHRTPRSLKPEYSIFGRIWENIRGWGQWVLRRDPFFQMGHRKARALLVCNAEARAIIPDKWSQKTQIFPVSGISSEDLNHKSSPKQSLGQFRILSAGSLIRIKGFALTIRSFKVFANKHSDAKLTIIGSGPEEATLRSLIQQLGLEELVNIVPSVPREQLLSKMADCDVFLFPSLRDGGGTVVIEAMALGRPVVCLDTGGPGMHITEECGIKISPGTPNQTERDLAEALERLYVNDGLRKSLGEAARDKIKGYYLWDRLGDRIAEIYQQAVSAQNN